MTRDEVLHLTEENARLRRELTRLLAERASPANPDEDLEHLLVGLEVGVFVLDGENRFVKYRAGKLGLVAAPEDFLGRRVDQVFPPSIAEPILASIRRAKATREAVRLEYSLELPTKPGKPERFEAWFTAKAEGGTAVLVSSATERYRMESELRASERRFRTLIERATDILYVLDGDFVVRFWSPGATQALGWKAEEAIGKYGLEFLHPDDLGGITRPSTTDAPGSSGLFHYRVKHRDGGWRHLEATVRNFLADPDVAGIVINARDVTVQRELEARSNEARKLESIGRLAGGVAHGFNNLLTVILGCGGFLQEALQAGRLPDPDDLDEIMGAAHRARDLAQQLLAFARRQIIAPVALDLNRFLNEHEHLLRRVVGEHVTLDVRLSDDPCVARIDPAQLLQVVLNLAANARDAMPHGGRLELGVAVETLGADRAADLAELPPGPHARLWLRDNGPGLPPEVRDHLFEPFFTTKEPGKGTGLGLATVHGIVGQSGGAISVTSEPGRGTTFELHLPAAQERPSTTDRAGPREHERGHETILLVEDDEAVGAITERVLREGGYRVLYASDGHEAIALAKREPRLDLLVADVVLPGLDGPGVAAEVQRLHAALPVLFVSGYTQDTLGLHGVADADRRLLPKPFTPSALLSHVRRALASAG